MTTTSMLREHATPAERSGLAALAETLDAAFRGAALVAPVRGADGIVCDLICTDITPGAAALLGHPRPQCVGASLAERLSADLHQSSLHAAERVLERDEPLDSPTSMIARADRNLLRTRLAPHGDGLLVTWADTSSEAELRAHVALLERRAMIAEERLADSFIASPDPFALFDVGDRLVLCNEAWIELFGLQEVDPVIGRRFEELINLAGDEFRDDRHENACRAYLRWRLDARIAPSDELYEMTLADGRTFRLRERPTHDGGIVCIGSEVTEIFGQRQALFRTLEAVDHAVALFDPEDRLVVWNHHYAEAIGHDVVQEGMSFEATTWAAFSKPPHVTTRDGRELAIEERLSLHKSGCDRLEFERRYEDGTVLLVRERRSDDGWLVLTGTPITELKQKEAALEHRVRDLDAARAIAERQTDKLAALTRQLTQEKERAEAASRTKSHFLANMSHELRTPLNAILGFSEVLKLESFGPLGFPRYREYAEDIHASGRHLLSLINDILDMSKVEAGKYRLMIEEVPLAEVVENAVRMVRGRASEADLHLAVARIDPGLLLRIDPRAVKQVLINIMVNAVKFTPRGGFVDVDYSEDAETVRLIVRDTGCGIDPRDVERLLRPFEQADDVGTQRMQGTGLGLPLSHALIELHGGRLILDGSPGVGTSVTIELPRAERDPT